MNKREIDTYLDSVIRRKKGFYYKGKKYNGVAFLDDCLEIHTNDYKDVVYINYEDIKRIENVTVGNELHKTIFTI